MIEEKDMNLATMRTQYIMQAEEIKALTKTTIEHSLSSERAKSLQCQLDQMSAERGLQEQDIRKTVQREHEQVIQEHREHHIRLQDRLEQTNKKLQSEVDKMSLLSANSSRKGALMEASLRTILEETLKVDVWDMSGTPHSMDIGVSIAPDLDVFIDAKNYPNTLPVKEVAKFEGDKSNLMGTNSKAHGFILFTKNTISSTVPATLVASHLFRYKGSVNTYIVTGNSVTALFQAMFLVARARCSGDVDASAKMVDDVDSSTIPEYNNILRRMIPLFRNNNTLVQGIEALMKQHKQTHKVDSAALATQFDLSGLEGIEDINLMKSLGGSHKKRQRL